MESQSDQATHDYVIAHSSYEPEVLQQLYRETWTKIYAPQMIAGHMQGSLLRMISQMINPENILEIGTFTGYSAICLAVGLQIDGKLHTIELNRELEEIAARYIEMAGLLGKIVRHYGDASEIIPTLDMQFDLVYIDAAKELYVEFYEMALTKIRIGGFILADNALWYGKVADPSVINDKDTEAIRKFNFHVQSDPRTENLILPVRDGIMLIRKK
ncbi:MAG: class I SAM-dependent methyltransferase [Bacteroidales bacterium]|nr:class I SAM-dependent methyltransferase [Bacteroidales bacterium]